MAALLGELRRWQDLRRAHREATSAGDPLAMEVVRQMRRDMRVDSGWTVLAWEVVIAGVLIATFAILYALHVALLILGY